MKTRFSIAVWLAAATVLSAYGYQSSPANRPWPPGVQKVSDRTEEAFELVGRALGEVAMQELLGNADVDKAIGEYAQYLSEEDFKPLIDSLDKAQSK